MSANTKIEWATKTWNPLRGCSKVSEGCRNCYAIRVAHRFSGVGMPYEGLTKFGPGGPNWTGKIRLVPEALDEPLRWRKPERVFVNSMSDLFHPDVPDEYIDRVFAVMALCPQHTFQILTKRPERMNEYFRHRYRHVKVEIAAVAIGIEAGVEEGGEVTFDWPLPNVWLGVSVENQKAADERIPLLLQTSAAVRFLSCEPLLGPVDLRNVDYERTVKIDSLTGLHGWPYPHAEQDKRIHWVIVGGESGPNARPMHPDWVRSIRDQCKAAGVPFFHKQNGEWVPAFNQTLDTPNSNMFHRFEDGLLMKRVGKKKADRLLDGRTWDEYPT